MEPLTSEPTSHQIGQSLEPSDSTIYIPIQFLTSCPKISSNIHHEKYQESVVWRYCRGIVPDAMNDGDISQSCLFRENWIAAHGSANKKNARCDILLDATHPDI
jgi:hypothetical protein